MSHRRKKTRRRRSKATATLEGVPGTIEVVPPEPVEIEPDLAVASSYAAGGALSYREYRMDDVRVAVTLLPAGTWLMTVSHPSRYVTWDEVKVARYRLLPPDTTMAMFLPPAAQYVNGERYAFHLFEVASEDALPPLGERFG